MSKPRAKHRRGKPGAGPPKASEPARPVAPSGSSESRRRKTYFRFVALLMPLALVGLLELGLRWGGYGYKAAFFVHHPAAPAGFLVENQRFAWRFFPPVLARPPRPLLVPQQKPVGTRRIFVFGESAAMGDPDPAFGFSRILELLLRERHPDMQVEVFNVSFTAISSHVLLPMARECAGLAGDVWLVYMGNNEVVGPFGAGTVFGQQAPPLPVIRATLALKSTCTGQLLDGLMRGVGGATETPKYWDGMKMMLEHQVRQDDPRMERVYANFRRNLSDILRQGTDSGAKVIVSTVVSNLRDCPPFGSLHRAELAEPTLASWTRAHEAGVAAEAAGGFAAAIAGYEAAAQLDDTFAELHYRWGRCCLKLRQLAEAKVHFERARDLDTRRFRADGQINETIRQVATRDAAPEVRLLDAEAAFAQRSADGIVGDEWLYEHVHLRFEGNYLLARLFAEQIADLWPDGLPRSANDADEWLSAEECARRLAYTDYNRYWGAEWIRQRITQPPFTIQLEHAERYRRLEEEATRLRAYTKPSGLRQAIRICQQAVSRRDGDWVLHYSLAELLAVLGDVDGAVAEWCRVNQLMPHYARAYTEAAKLLDEHGRTEEALALFRQALQVNPDRADAHYGLGLIRARQGQNDEAARHFREALRLEPAHQGAALNLEKLTGGR